MEDSKELIKEQTQQVWVVVGVHGAYVDWRHTRKEMKEHHCLTLGLEKNGRADWGQAKAKGDRCVKALLKWRN